MRNADLNPPLPLIHILNDAEREANREFYDEVKNHYWRCVSCDLTFDGEEMAENGLEFDNYGSIVCPNCYRHFNYDERSKK